MSENNLIGPNYEKILDLVSVPIKNDKQRKANHNKVLKLLKEDGFKYTEDNYIAIFKTTLIGLTDEIKNIILCKDTIEDINTNFSRFLKYINENILESQSLQDYGYTLVICYYIYLTG